MISSAFPENNIDKSFLRILGQNEGHKAQFAGTINLDWSDQHSQGKLKFAKKQHKKAQAK